MSLEFHAARATMTTPTPKILQMGLCVNGKVVLNHWLP